MVLKEPLLHRIVIALHTFAAILAGFAMGYFAFRIALRERDRDYAIRLAAYNPDPVIFCSNNRIKIWNESAEQKLGYKKEEMLGKSPISIMPTSLIDEHQVRQDQLETAKEGDEGFRFLIVPIKHKNGKVFKHLVTISHIKEKNQLIAIARIVDNQYFRPLTWYDVLDRKERSVSLYVDGVEFLPEQIHNNQIHDN